MPFGFGARAMLSASWKSYMCRCAFAMMLAATVVSLVGQPVVAQAPPDASAQKANPTPANPAAKSATEATTVAATPVSLDKPPAPRLTGRYQQAKELTPDQEKEYTRKRSKIQSWLRSGVISPENEAEFNDYYKRYALARWTWVKRQQDVAKYRSELGGDLTTSYKANRGTNQAHDKLQALALPYLEAFVNPANNSAPTTRFNAILAIAGMNEVESSIGNKLAKPLPQALGKLRACVRDTNQVDAVRLGALIGIRRHCRLMMAAGTEPPRDLLGELAGWAQRKESLRVRSDEGHAWMRLVAIRTFSDVKGAPKPDYVAGMFRGIVSEKESADFLRYEAAAALGSINYRETPGLNLDELLHTLGLLAIEICDVERQRLRDELESERIPSSSTGYMGSGYGDEGAEMGMEDGGYGEMDMYGSGAMTTTTTTATDRQIERVRRRLQQGMTAALIGMGRKSRTVRSGEEIGLNMMIENTKIETFSVPIHDFFKVIDAKDEDDLRIQAKPLDEAIAEVRQKLADALSQIGPEAPPSPEFEPIPETKRPAMGGGYGEMYGEESMYGEP